MEQDLEEWALVSLMSAFCLFLQPVEKAIEEEVKVPRVQFCGRNRGE
jgi:hypothetical protein